MPDDDLMAHQRGPAHISSNAENLQKQMETRAETNRQLDIMNKILEGILGELREIKPIIGGISAAIRQKQ